MPQIPSVGGGVPDSPRQAQLRGTRALDKEATVLLEPENSGVSDNEILQVMDRIVARYGRSGSGRASALRLIGAYVLFQTEGAAGFRKRGFSRMSVQLYREKLADAGVRIP